MKQPEDVQLSREEGEALLARLEANTLTADARRVLGKVLTAYFWLLFALREAKLSLKRIKALVFGEKPKPPKPPAAGGGSPGENDRQANASQGVHSSTSISSSEKKPPPGHGRQGAEVYRAAQTGVWRPAALAAGERCPARGRRGPAGGRGNLYRLPPGVEMRLDGNALLSAVRYELEKLRCSACGQIFTA